MIGGGRSGWFKESARHAMAARGIPTSTRYFIRKRYGVESLGKAYAGKDVLKEWQEAREDVKKYRQLAKEFQEKKQFVPESRREEFEELRAEAAKQRDAAKERLGELARELRYREEEGLLDPDQRVLLLKLDRERRAAKLEQEEMERLGAKQKDARAKARTELEDKDFLELEEVPIAMAAFVQTPPMKEGRVAQEKFKISKEKRKLGFREARPVEELVLPRRGVAKITGVKPEPLRDRVAKKEFEDLGIEVVDIPAPYPFVPGSRRGD